MTDKELLELAAKAADYRYWQIEDIWNPLTDDGDALRLAVKLCLLDNHEIAIAPVNVWHGDDPYAATRRAIVRAAAEIGKQKK
jgi:hypothetical protein